MPWRVDTKKSGIKLPPGFILEEDEDFVYLFRGDTHTLVATFSAIGADPREIERAAQEAYLFSTSNKDK